MTSKEAKAYMDANMIALETNYLVQAGYTEYQASFFISLEEQLIQNNSDDIKN